MSSISSAAVVREAAASAARIADEQLWSRWVNPRHEPLDELWSEVLAVFPLFEPRLVHHMPDFVVSSDPIFCDELDGFPDPVVIDGWQFHAVFSLDLGPQFLYVLVENGLSVSSA